MNIKKRIISLILAIFSVLPSVLWLSSCSDDVPKTTTTVAPPSQNTQTEASESSTAPITPPESTVKDMTEEDPKICITEVMVANFVAAKDEDGNYTPWIEVYNKSEAAVDLSEYSISYKSGESVSFPKISLAPGEYALFFANGKNTQSSLALSLDVTGELTVFHGEL